MTTAGILACCYRKALSTKKTIAIDKSQKEDGLQLIVVFSRINNRLTNIQSHERTRYLNAGYGVNYSMLAWLKITKAEVI